MAVVSSHRKNATTLPITMATGTAISVQRIRCFMIAKCSLKGMGLFLGMQGGVKVVERKSSSYGRAFYPGDGFVKYDI
jgi:hypothetical protein